MLRTAAVACALSLLVAGTSYAESSRVAENGQSALRGALLNARDFGLSMPEVPLVPAAGGGLAYRGLRQDALAVLENEDSRLSWTQIERVVRFGKRSSASGLPGAIVDKLTGAFGSADAASSSAETFARKAVDRMQDSSEGRRVLRELLKAYAAADKTALVRADAFDSSEILPVAGIECLVGQRGFSNPYLGSYAFNRRFMELQDKDSAVEVLAANMAHEFQHLASWAQIEAAGGLRDVFQKSLVNERSARLTGYLVAVQLYSGRANEYTEAAKVLAQDPAAFWARLKLDYSPKLDADELHAPSAAYEKRRKAMLHHLGTLSSDREPELREALSAIRTLSEKEGLSQALAPLREEAAFALKILPFEISAVEDKLSRLESLASRDEGSPYESELKSPAYRAVVERAARQEAELLELLRRSPLPDPVPAQGQLDWKGLDARVRKSQAAHPEYWAQHLSTFGSRETPRAGFQSFN
ncbi:MAG: hypothetical protein WCU88_09310 [Elusimicrobiota bacterium]|jgi:hypothetical protein